MVRFPAFFFCSMFLATTAMAQIPDGTTAPDFTFKDINGNTQNLYSWLNQGKYVAIDVSATWCEPCWDYHELSVLDSLYEKHDFPGDQKWKVMFIEGDDNTDSADLHGLGSGTRGNWVQGKNYIIIDLPAGIEFNEFFNAYGIAYYPTFFLICPNKKIFQQTLNSNVAPLKMWEDVAAYSCFAAGIDDPADKNPITVFPNPATTFTNLYFRINSSLNLKLEITNILGQSMDVSDFGLLLPGDQLIRYETADLKPGLYFFNIYSGGEILHRKKVVIK